MQTRRRIIEAAFRVVERHGLHRLTTNAVVAEAGISTGGFFYHFRTWDDLVARMRVEACSRRAGAVAARMRTVDGFEAQLREAFVAELAWASMNPRESVFLALCRVTPDLPPVPEGMEQRSPLARLVAAGGAAGETRPLPAMVLEDLAESVMEAAVRRLREDPILKQKDPLIEQLFSVLLAAMARPT
jgi:AcrR family transcriptional regulator